MKPLFFDNKNDIGKRDVSIKNNSLNNSAKYENGGEVSEADIRYAGGGKVVNFKYSLTFGGITIYTNIEQEYVGKNYSPFESKGSFKATVRKGDLENIAIESESLKEFNFKWGEDDWLSIVKKLKLEGINELELFKVGNIIKTFELKPINSNTDIRYADGGSLNKKWSSINDMTKSEAKKFYESKEGKELDKQTYNKWKLLVNMSASELESFYNTEDGKEAGLSSEKANQLGISSGRESARWIMKMKKIPYTKWTDAMWIWAKKQISFISRMSGNKGDLYDDKGNKTRKHTSLLIWGHNPKKMGNGGNVITYRNKFNKKYGFELNESHSLEEISKLTNLKLSPLQDIYNKGVGAYKTNPESVRPNVKSKEQWAMARVYSAVMGGKAAKVDKNELLEATKAILDAKRLKLKARKARKKPSNA
jgi:hypothetical protein